MGYVVKSDAECEQVLKDLSGFYPKSYMMETMLRNSVRKHCDWPGMEFVLDKWPKWDVVLCRPRAGSPDYVNRCSKYSVSIFCKDIPSLQSFLDVADVLDWSQPISFHAIPRPDEFECIKKKCLTVNPTLRYDGTEYCHVFLLFPDKIETLPVPPGLHLGELRESAHADYVLERWEYTRDESRPYVHHLLAKDSHFPNSAIFDMDTGLPVAYIIYSCDGALGFGWVSPNYRNKGLFQIVNYDLAQKLFQLGHQVAWAYVVSQPANEASIRAYERMGAEKANFQIDFLGSLPAERKEG